MLLLPATVSHLGRLISLPVVLSTTQNTISNPAGVRAVAPTIGIQKELLNNAMRHGKKETYLLYQLSIKPR